MSWPVRLPYMAINSSDRLTAAVQGEPRKGGEYWGGVPQFTPDAELINGRVAMLGFAGLLFVEAIKGRAVF